MDSLQPVLAVLFVLGLLGGGLYLLRSKGIAQFNGKAFNRSGGKQMQLLERLSLTPHHSLHLVNVNGRILLVAVSPNGCDIADCLNAQPPIGERR